MFKLVRVLVSLLVAVGIFAASALAENRSIMSTDFANSKYKVSFKKTDTQDISGKLPAGWGDNSEWNAEITLSYSPVEENKVAFLRMAKDASGRAQLNYGISKKMPAGTYKLTMQLKSDASTTPEIGIRLRNEPYTFLWTTKPALTDSWETFTEEFDLDTGGEPVGIYVCIDGEGTLDIKSIAFEEVL